MGKTCGICGMSLYNTARVLTCQACRMEQQKARRKKTPAPVSAPVPVLDMTPTGSYGDGSPRYKFHTSFPSRNVRVLAVPFATPEEAWKDGIAAIRAYENRDPYGNMGETLGVTRRGGMYHAVINLYHSGS